VAGRGFDARISTEFVVELPESACVYCGNCIAVCPTGALMPVSEFEMRRDGTWDESLATGTGFPNVFYLRYTLYRNYFPLLALTHARRALEEAERSLRLVQETEPSRPIR